MVKRKQHDNSRAVPYGYERRPKPDPVPPEPERKPVELPCDSSTIDWEWITDAGNFVRFRYTY